MSDRPELGTAHKSKFVLDTLRGVYKGYATDETWNGFACPYFEKDEADRILKNSEENGYSWSYDGKKGAYIVTHKDDPEDWEPAEFVAATLTVGHKTLTVYPIGAYSWTWFVSE